MASPPPMAITYRNPRPMITTLPYGMAVVNQHRYFPVFQFGVQAHQQGPIHPHGAFFSSPFAAGRTLHLGAFEPAMGAGKGIRDSRPCIVGPGKEHKILFIHTGDLAVLKSKRPIARPAELYPKLGVNRPFLERSVLAIHRSIDTSQHDIFVILGCRRPRSEAGPLEIYPRK